MTFVAFLPFSFFCLGGARVQEYKTIMLLVLSQAACIARRIIINSVAARNTSLICIIVIPFLLALVPRLVGPLLIRSLRMDPPHANVPRCSSILGVDKCSLLVITVDRPDLIQYGEAMAKSFSTEPRTPVSVDLNATHKTFASARKDVMFVPNTADFDKIVTEFKSSVVTSLKLSVRQTTSIIESRLTNNSRKFDPKILTTRLDIYSRQNSHLLPADVFLPFRLLLTDLQWFIPDIVNVAKMLWPFVCIPVIAPLLILITVMNIVGNREQRFERHLKINGLRHSAWVLGTFGGMVAVTLAAFYFTLLGQSFIGSYWNELASLPVWLTVWTTIALALVTLLMLVRSIGGLMGYILAVFGVTSGVVVSLVASLFDVSMNSDLMYVYSFVKFTASKDQFTTPRQVVYVGETILFAFRLLLWPLRLPVLMLVSIGFRAVDPNALLMGRFKVDQVRWSHLMNPETSLTMIHASIAYYINLYLPIVRMQSANLQALKQSIGVQLDFLAALVERVSMNMFLEILQWFLSVTVICLISWYFQEISDSEGPNYGNPWFCADYYYWIPESIPDKNDHLTVELPSGKFVAMNGCVLLENCNEQDRIALMGLSEVPSITVGKAVLNPSFLPDLRSTNLELDKWPSDFTCRHAIRFMCYMRGSVFREFWSSAEDYFLGLEQVFETPISELSADEKAILSLLLASTGTNQSVILYDPMKDVVEREKVLGYIRSLATSRGVLLILDGSADEDIQKLAVAITPENTV